MSAMMTAYSRTSLGVPGVGALEAFVKIAAYSTLSETHG
jgi:hypothetical protein